MHISMFLYRALDLRVNTRIFNTKIVNVFHNLPEELGKTALGDNEVFNDAIRLFFIKVFARNLFFPL